MINFKGLSIKLAYVTAVFLSMQYGHDLQASSIEKFSVNIEGFFDQLNVHPATTSIKPMIFGTQYDEKWIDESTLNLKGLAQSTFSPVTDSPKTTLQIPCNTLLSHHSVNIQSNDSYPKFFEGKRQLGDVDKPALNSVDINPLVKPNENFPYALQRVSATIDYRKGSTDQILPQKQCEVDLIIPENWILNFKEPQGKINMTGTFANTISGKLGESCQMSMDTIDSQDPIIFQLAPHGELTIKMLKAPSLSLDQDSFSKLNVENLNLTNPEAINSISIGRQSKIAITNLQSSGNIHMKTEDNTELKVRLCAKLVSFLIGSNSKAIITTKSTQPNSQMIDDFTLKTQSDSNINIYLFDDIDRLKVILDINTSLKLRSLKKDVLIKFLDALIAKHSLLQANVRIGHISHLFLSGDATADFTALDDEIIPKDIIRGPSYNTLHVPSAGYKRVLGLVPASIM